MIPPNGVIDVEIQARLEMDRKMQAEERKRREYMYYHDMVGPKNEQYTSPAKVEKLGAEGELVNGVYYVKDTGRSEKKDAGEEIDGLEEDVEGEFAVEGDLQDYGVQQYHRTSDED
jgi:hypothetical protein